MYAVIYKFLPSPSASISWRSALDRRFRRRHRL